MLEPIHLNDYAQADRAGVQASVSEAVMSDPRHFIEQYKKNELSFGGRYIAADLFKELFAQYSESKETRNRYNSPVHNSAAVLSAALFRETLADRSHPERNTVVFLTGIPGAGKTSTLQLDSELPSNYRAVFEGQLSNPETTKEKIRMVLDVGLKPVVIAVHARPENALKNTFKRFEELGRGASINVMSTIQGGLPDSLQQAYERFGEAIELRIFDYRDRLNPSILAGWNHLDVLRSEGNLEQIKQRLSDALEQHRRAGSISEANYRQASGAPPLDRGSELAISDSRKHEANVDGRGVPPADRKKAVVAELGLSPTSAHSMANTSPKATSINVDEAKIKPPSRER